MMPSNHYTNITHAFTRIVKDFSVYLKKIEVAYTELGVCESYFYRNDKCEGVNTIFTADNRIVVKIRVNTDNISKVGYFFNNKRFSASPEEGNVYQAAFTRLMDDESELVETMKRFFGE